MEYLLILLNKMCKVHAVPVLANSTGWSTTPVYYSTTDRCHDVVSGNLEDTLAHELLFIFLDFGAPHVLQSDNSREFTAQDITELSSLWPEQLVLVNGRPRHPQNQGSVERTNGIAPWSWKPFSFWMPNESSKFASFFVFYKLPKPQVFVVSPMKNSISLAL